MLLALKLTLVPALVLLASLATRRWGSRIGGLLTGLPIVSAPALFFFAVEHVPEGMPAGDVELRRVLFVLSLTIVSLGAAAFGLATVSALVIQGAVLWGMQRAA